MIFSDDKKLNRDGPDVFLGYWKDLRKEPRYFSKRNFGGGSIMVWGGGAFSRSGTVPLTFPSCRMNSAVYPEILKANLLLYMHSHWQKSFPFQQDNARTHTSSSTKPWLQTTILDTWHLLKSSPRRFEVNHRATLISAICLSVEKFIKLSQLIETLQRKIKLKKQIK